MSTATDTPKTAIIEPNFQHIVFSGKNEIETHNASQSLKSDDQNLVELISSVLSVSAAPTTNNYGELMEEIRYTNSKGYMLLNALYLSDFKSCAINTTLKGTGPAWEVGEAADYEVQFVNRAWSNLKDIKISLSILSPSSTTNAGGVQIITPPGNTISLGDIGYGQSKTATFKLRANKGGDVLLAISASGTMESFKNTLQYDGYSWNGSTWVYDNNWRKPFHIYG